jgi:putative ABC transport system permease protein
MMKFILKLIIRNLVKSKFYSIAVIVGFSIAISMVTLNVMLLVHEYSSDSFHTKKQEIFRLLMRNAILKEGQEHTAWTYYDHGLTLKREFPDVQAATFIYSPLSEQEFTIDSKKYRIGRLLYADSSFFRIFDFKKILGDITSCLDKPNSIVLTKNVAIKYFGTTDVLGNSVFHNGEHCIITAVLEDLPTNSSLTFDALISINSIVRSGDTFDSQGITYLLLRDGSNFSQLEKKINEKSGLRNWQNDRIDFSLESLDKVYFHTYSSQDTSSKIFNNRSKKFLYIIIILVVLTLTTAIFNHATFTRAKLVMQTKQVLIHRILGGLPWQSFIYYFLESLIILSIAFLLALLSVTLILPYYNASVNASIQLEYFTPQKLFIVGFAIMFSVSVLIGLFIQFVLGIKSEKRFVNKIFGGNALDYLVLIQTTFSIGLLSFLTIVYSQLQYIKNFPLGYVSENLISISLEELPRKFNLEILKEELLKHHSITKVSVCSGSPISGFSMDTDRIDGNDYTMRSLEGDAEYLEIFQFELIEGRNYDSRIDSDSTAIIINQAASNLLNAKVGKRLPGYLHTVVGIVKNFNHGSLKEPIGPVLLGYNTFKRLKPLQIVIAAKVIDRELLNTIQSIWSKVTPDVHFQYKNIKDEYITLHKKEFSFIKLITLSSISSFVITLFGITGLSFYNAQKRTKEMAIRKIHGASKNDIIMIFVGRICLGIVIAALIATPISIYVSHKWLQNFVFRTDINIWMTGIPIGITFIFVMMSTLSHIVIVANKNPSSTLKYD